MTMTLTDTLTDTVLVAIQQIITSEVQKSFFVFVYIYLFTLFKLPITINTQNNK